MKNLKKLIVLLFTVIIVSGCVKVETNMKISMNKKMDFEIIMAVDKNLLEENEIYQDELLDDKQKEELTNQGFEIKKYEDNNQIGNIITKKFDSIDYLSSTEDINYDLSSVINDPLSTAYIFKVEKGFIKNKYIAKYDLNSIENNTNTSYSLDIFDIVFKVSLPYKALENNATSIDNKGKELVWDMTKTTDPIEFEFEIYNIKNIVAIGLGILIIVLIIINRILVFIAKRGNKEKKEKKVKKEKVKKQEDNNQPRFIMPQDMGN